MEERVAKVWTIVGWGMLFSPVWVMVLSGVIPPNIPGIDFLFLLFFSGPLFGIEMILVGEGVRKDFAIRATPRWLLILATIYNAFHLIGLALWSVISLSVSVAHLQRPMTYSSPLLFQEAQLGIACVLFPIILFAFFLRCEVAALKELFPLEEAGDEETS